MYGLRFARLWLWLGIALVAAVWYLSLTDRPPSVELPGRDKTAHLIAYGAQTLWFAWLYPRRRHCLIVVLFIVQGVLLELLQGMTPARFMEPADMLANSAGALSAWVIASSRLGDALRRLDRGLARAVAG